MDNSLEPTYQRLFGDFWVLWFEASNSYSIVESKFKNLLDYYFQSETTEVFTAKLAIEDKSSNPLAIFENIQSYLKNCNLYVSTSTESTATIDISKRSILKYYSIKGRTIQICYGSELVLKTIHPALDHLSVEKIADTQVTFDVYLKNEQLHLYKNEQLITRVPKRDYHLIQGKFIIHLLCSIHDKIEEDWIGTFHGSTITDGNTSILFVGKSGKGKSTLCAILANSGLDLLTDDVSPMLSETKEIYYNPLAISVKEGAFNVLQPLIESFQGLPIVQFNKNKGLIKYMPCIPPKKNAYPCSAVIVVNYENKAETKLESIPTKTMLETLIPDSWLSPNPIHAKEFLDWLETVSIYKLTYSDTKNVTKAITNLFQQLNKT